MKKRKTKHSKLWAIVILAIFLLAAPVLQAADDDEIVPPDQTKDIDFEVKGILWVDGTANLLTGASASSVYVQDGGILNIYSGTVDVLINISPSAAGMTVYGTDFVVSNSSIDLDGYWTPAEVIVGGTSTVGMGTLTGKYEDESQIDLWILSDTPIKLVDLDLKKDEVAIEIDIKPGSSTNSINLKSRGVVPVALLSADEFNAGDIDPGSVEFAGASPVRSTLCDVDEDGDLDMLFHFRTQDLTELNEDSTDATLTATIDGVQIEATDSVRIVPCNEKKKNNQFSVSKKNNNNYHSSDKKYKFSNRHTPKQKRPVQNHKDR